jgi:hypothetical protein
MYQGMATVYDGRASGGLVVANNPLNNTDPTGQCKNDSSCEGSFDAPSKPTERPQNGVSLQYAFQSGNGETFVADPAAFNLDEGIDIGTQIQSSINDGGYYASFAQKALANPGTAVSIPTRAGAHGFNGELTAMATRESARSIGRFSGEVAGATITAGADGSYELTGNKW